MPNIGPLEIIIVLVIVLLIFGPKRRPEMRRSVGRGMREFKDSVTGKGRDDEPAEIEAGPDRADAREAAAEDRSPAGARGAGTADRP